MISAGIDCGAKTVKVVLVSGGVVLGRALTLAGLDTAAAAEEAFRAALADAGETRDQVGRIIATGVGKNEPAVALGTVTEVGAAARGARELDAGIRTVIDVGAEEARAIRMDGSGRVVDFAINEKCAAGTGAFAEAMARALEVTVDELGELALRSEEVISINAQCVVFAESEVVSLVHRRTPKPDMARAILDAIAERVTALTRRVDVEQRVALIGGVSRNVGFVRALERGLGFDLCALEDPEFVGALGAACIAAEGS
jgi:benzoyl-CoA reductase subunit D